MTQKIIRIGSSAGVTIPKKELEELGLAIGDEAEVTIKPVNISRQKYVEELDKFMAIYDEDLKSLAKR